MANSDDSHRPAEFSHTLVDLEAVAALLVGAGPERHHGEDLRRYVALVERMGDLAAGEGLLGLLDVCLLYGGVLEPLVDLPVRLDETKLKTLAVWPGLVKLYLRKPDLPATGTALVAHLCRPCWGVDMPGDETAQLAESLATLPPRADGEFAPGNRETPDGENDLEQGAGFSALAFDRTGDAVTAGEPLDAGPPLFDGTEGSAGAGDAAALIAVPLDAGPPLFDETEDSAGAGDAAPLIAVPLDAGPPLFDETEDSAGAAEQEPLLAASLDAVMESAGLFADSHPLMAAESPQMPRTERALSASALELLGVIIHELPEVETALDALLGLATCPGVERELVEESYANAINVTERVAAAAESIGLAGLKCLCAHAAANLSAIRDAPDGMDAEQPGLWRGFVPAMRAYLEAPLSFSPIADLAAFASSSRHASPLGGAALEELQILLGAPDFSVLEAQMPARPSVASDEDVSLAIPRDVNPELLDGLLQELPQQTEEFSSAIQRLIHGGTLDDVNIAQRVAHTLKGAGNTVGVRGLAELTHQIEDVLLSLAKHEVLPTRALADTMMNAADCLEGMTESLLGIGPAPADRRQVLQSVLDWANRIDREGPPRDAEASALVPRPAPGALATPGAVGPDELPHAGAGADAGPESAEAAPDSPGDADREAGGAMLRVPARIVDDLLRLVGEAIILSSQLHDGVRRTQQNARLMEDQFEHLRTLGGELERLVDVKDFSIAHGGQRRSSEFDALEMDQYSELHTYSRRLIEAALDAREMGRSVLGSLTQLDDMLTTQETLNRDTHEGVLNTRLVPVKSFFPRLQRSARQASRLTAKRAELELSGGETLMDSEVLGQIVDPLMHLLRNAIDHGIEAPEARLAQGKDPQGRVSLEFLRDGSNILVRCSDDGAGLDFAAIRLAAERRGLLAEGEEASEEDLKNLILRPNFTTRQQATQTSGRGVGLDAVYSRIAELGGALTIKSSAGRGCVFDVRLPVTLLSSHALLVRAGGQTIALTSRGLEQIVHVEDGELRQFGSELVFQAADQIYPAQALDAVLGMPGPLGRAGQLAAYRSVLIVRRSAGLVAVLVESIVASRELVVKNLGAYIPKLRGIVGGTILGDGSVTPVIDVAELLREHGLADVRGTMTGTTHTSEAAALPLALVVDDSLSARRALAQLLSDSGFKVLTARDGMEAVETLENTSPDILFVDLEMPRMNGIELTMHVRAKPQMAKVPVIMVTSRSTVKHRQQAESAGVNAYITKPFADDMVLEHTRDLLAHA